MKSENKIISEELLEILVCPVCKTQVKTIKKGKNSYGLECRKCLRLYPVRDGIPIMLESEAEIQDL